MHVLHVTRDPDVGGEQGLVVLDVESDADLTGCPDCGVVAVGHGRHIQVLHDAPDTQASAHTITSELGPHRTVDNSGGMVQLLYFASEFSSLKSMEEVRPTCALCSLQYDPTFMSGLACRVHSWDDRVTPGCPPQQQMIAELRAQVAHEERRKAAPAASGGGCLMCVMVVLAFIAVVVLG